ncbi:MAG: hypothetical protein WC503_00585 [Candidatus Shapirobacteria bacterium]
MIDIDVVRTSASRPELLKISTESIKKNLKYSGKLRFLLHEDKLNEKASAEVMEYAHSCGLYDVIRQDEAPMIGHKRSFLWLFSQTITKYVIHFEDDYELIKELDLDPIVNLMEKYPDRINQICFSKRDILPDKPGFVKHTEYFDGIPLTTSQHWMMVPSIWRMSFAKKGIDGILNYKVHDFHWELNKLLKGRNVINNAEWVLRNTKTFYYGKVREGKLVEHIGKIDKSVREKTYKW